MRRKLAIFFTIIFLLLPIIIHDMSYIMHILILCFFWGVVATVWDLILGYASIFSLGQIAFFGFAGYLSAMLSLSFGMSPWITIIIGACATAIIGIGVGLICLNLKGIYIGVVTLALELVLPTLITEGRQFGTGGSRGLIGIPNLHILGYSFNSLSWYFTALFVFIAVLFIIHKIIESRLGLAFVALRDARDFARCLGVNEYKYKLIVFGISSFLTGLVGGFYTHYVGMISPLLFGTDIFVMALAMVLLGGLGRFPGAAIGAFVITFANEILRSTGLFRLLIIGAIAVITIIYLPQGLIGIFDYLDRFVSLKIKKLKTNNEFSKL